MPTSRSLPLRQEWKERLGLASRKSPELFEISEAVRDVSHAPSIRAALDDLGLSAVFCVQAVPTVAILSVEQYENERIIDLHGALWNQGLASLLLVIHNDTLRAFSLLRKPYRESQGEFDKRCLIDTLNQTADALRIRNLILGVESGRLWKDYASHFQTKDRIDQFLLDNLKESRRLLCQANLTSDAAQALLIQAMFIAYLEDRQIITSEYFSAVTGLKAKSFGSLLDTGNAELLKSLFAKLRNDFNGDLFVAPCSFEERIRTSDVTAAHLSILSRFRAGQEEMGRGGQLRLHGYNFRYIPIELVSAVYDRFLGEEEDLRREQGAYYTPMFLADTVVSQVWDRLSPEIREQGLYLDPACGSGVFLVRLFQRLCERWRSTNRLQTIPWDSLLTILSQVNGWDLNGSAVRVAVFSLYVALLEEVSPPDILHLIKRGKILPELWDHTLVSRDFFDVPENIKFHVIIGNPPWASRRGPNRSSVRWCKINTVPMPSGEDAWAFAWKAARHLEIGGVVAFLFPAMGFLHNNATNSVNARNQFIRENSVYRIINFADLRFQLFEHAHRPAALIMYGSGDNISQTPYRFDYWAPKADLNIQLKRLITLSSADKHNLSTATAMDHPLVFKQRLWMRESDAKLFAYLSRLPKIGDLVKDYGGLTRRKQSPVGHWTIGQGFQPFNEVSDHGNSTWHISQYVGKFPNLPIGLFRRVAQPLFGLAKWPSNKVRRKGFEAGFEGARILIPRGVETSQTRLRATYTEEALTFQDIIQAITVPPNETNRGKLLNALLNSRVAVWYAFHGTASFGSDRPEVKQAELLHLPFPSPDDLPEPKRAKSAAKELVEIVDNAVAAVCKPLSLNKDNAVLMKIDQLAYQYFCLSEEEQVIIEDTVTKIIPAVQPSEGSFPGLWKAPSVEDRRAYATTLIANVKNWLRADTVVSARLEASSPDLGILCLSLNAAPTIYTEVKNASLVDVLSRISQHINQPLNGNFQLFPNLKVFIDKNLYLIKPMQLRFWLKSSALTDSDEIAMDLQDAIEIGRWSNSE